MNNFTEFDQQMMKLALREAKKGLGRVFPNPLVGAVIVKEKQVLAKGFHRQFGQDHAEIDALRKIQFQARGATLYVTLEPCNHYGKTPPCTLSILDAGIAKVICSANDPHPKARGGLDFLASKGVICQSGLLAEEALDQNRIFFFSLNHQRPFISLKLAQTLDGKIARQDGTSKWITSEKARQEVQKLRSWHQAILVGNQTVLNDNPRLDCRLPDKHSPLKILFDPQDKIPADFNVFKGETLIFNSGKRLDLPSHVEQIPFPENYALAWKELFVLLRQRGIISMLVEGGSEVASFLIQQGYVDYLYLFYGPKFFGHSGLPGLRLEEEHSLKISRQRSFDDTFLIEGVLCSPV